MGGQHMRRIGGLLAAGFQQALITEDRGHAVQEQRFGTTHNQPLAKLTEHGGIKAAIV